MSRFRDKFVGNADLQSINWYSRSANNSRDNFGTQQNNAHPETGRVRPYSPIEDGHSRHTPLRDERSYSNFQTDTLGMNKEYDTHNSAESYELTTVSQNPFDQSSTSLRLSNPFQSSNDLLNEGYTVSAQNDAQISHVTDAESESLLLEKHILHNERNRRMLANRLPRFHYTKLPWFSILVTTAQVIVFIVELVKMGIWTGSPFQTKPYFNPMIGPSTYVLINMGARYVPCMHKIQGITSDTSIQFPCPNSTSTDTNVCNLNELCGLSGIPIVDNEFVPSQYYRIVLPIFLHAGILHIFFNMILQLTMGLAVERSIGWLKYSIIYIASGVAGFLLGANFSQNGVASTGASGSLFGIIAANFLLFIYCGTKNTNIYETKRYKTFILIMVLEIVVSFVLGLLPGLDNFSHIGGFCMGVLTSILLLPDPSFVYKKGVYTYDSDTTTWKSFVDNWNPICKLWDKVRWKAALWAVARITSLVLAIVYFALLTKNLKSKKQENNEETCSWCKYFNCIPVNNWCEQGEVTVTTSVVSASTATPTSTSGASSTTAEVLNLPSEITNAKRSFYDEAPIESYQTHPKFIVGAKSLAAIAMSDSGSVALLVVVAYMGYNGARRLKTKISEKRKRKRESKKRVVL